MTISELLQDALGHHREGRLTEAARAYEGVLRLQPRQPDASYFLGVIAHQTGDQERAVELAKQAISSAGNHPQYLNLLGLAQMKLGDRATAEMTFRRAIALKKDPDSFNNLGICLKEDGRIDEAISAYDQAISADPRNADAYYNLGNAFRAKGQLENARVHFQKAVEANGSHGNAFAALAQAQAALGFTDEAVEAFTKALALLPDDADLYCDLGDLLDKSGRAQEAIAAYGGALRLRPRLSRAWYSAGCIENGRKNYSTASACFQMALEERPEWPEAMHNLAQALFHLGQVDEALAWFRRAATGKRGQVTRAMIAVMIPGCPSADNETVLETRRAWAETGLPAARTAERFASRASNSYRPMRIGYVSAFFHRDNWMKPVWGLINEHDRERFEIHLFSDAAESRIRHGYRRQSSDRFHDISGVSNYAAANLIERMEIDLLVDLNGYSEIRRLPLFALRPAPLIVGWFNMFATTGMSCYDFLIGDDKVIPPEEERFYTEKIARVPGSYLTFRVDYPVPEVTAAPSLASGVFTFGCLAPQYKITRRVMENWCTILQQAPRSLLLLKSTALEAPRTREYVQSAFAKNGIEAERLRLEGPADHYDFLKTYGQVDVALDTFPYNGGTTTTEAIWQGVPVISFLGDRWVSRTSSSILHAAGLGRFAGRTLDEYIHLAVQLANDPGTPAMLAELRETMR